MDVKKYKRNELMGFIILAISIGLQLLVFYLAIRIFLNPEFVQGFPQSVENDVADMGKMIKTLSIFFSAILLLVMGIISGLIGRYGLELSKHRSPDGMGDESIENE
ncbi:MAG: hypothetical protein KGY66_05955 [Candidatus Thermoplasmatota archaeon]|nr:hypothetical protein [Candidatus Thermoplasmatota archaeon]MBS3790443.1 hypothetical protein [Candidatus Thermoplasmatota archaeon]